jgi:hypothetical protein
VRRATGFLHELADLYDCRERQRLDALLQDWSAHDAASQELLEAPN